LDHPRFIAYLVCVPANWGSIKNSFPKPLRPADRAKTARNS